MRSLLTLDTDLFHFINHRCRCPFLDKIMPSITSLGNWVPASVIAIILIYIRSVPAANVLLSGFLTIIIINSIKALSKRLRPHKALGDVRLLKKKKLMFYDPSFPSAHTAIVSCMSTLFAFYHPGTMPFAALLVLLVGISRIYLGQHYPSDVIIGGIIGWLVTFVICTIR